MILYKIKYNSKWMNLQLIRYISIISKIIITTISTSPIHLILLLLVVVFILLCKIVIELVHRCHLLLHHKAALVRWSRVKLGYELLSMRLLLILVLGLRHEQVRTLPSWPSQVLLLLLLLLLLIVEVLRGWLMQKAWLGCEVALGRWWYHHPLERKTLSLESLLLT